MTRVPSILVWVVVVACCVVPVGYVLLVIALHPASLSRAVEVGVIGRTLGYNLLAATLATAVGWAVGPWARGHGGLVVLAALPLAMPPVALAYAGTEALRGLGVVAEPQGAADVLRGAATLAAWLWPVVAVAVALAPASRSVLEAASVDGGGRGRWRVARRAELPAAAAGGIVVWVLAMGEFAVWEPTGIRVTQTYVRQTWDTGGATLAARLAASAAAGLPQVAAVLALAGVAAALVRRRVDDADEPERPRGGWLIYAAVAAATLWPVVVLSARMEFWPTPAEAWATFGGKTLNGLALAGVVAGVSLAVALAACVTRQVTATLAALLAFLVGGQILAVSALTLIASTPAWVWGAVGWLYDGDGVVVVAHLGRYLWLPLAAALWARRRTDALWAQAAVDGADAWQAAARVTWPAQWPTLAAAALLAGLLSLTETSAAALLTPDTLTPLLLANVHTVRYGVMAQGALLQVALALGVGSLIVVLLRARR